jgi:hypothetical protein
MNKSIIGLNALRAYMTFNPSLTSAEAGKFINGMKMRGLL